MRAYNYIHYLLLIIIFAILLKFSFDFYHSNKVVSEVTLNDNVKHSKFIMQPRLQINSNKFKYLKASKGFIDADSNYVFENVESYGFYGNINAGKLVISENENVFEFTINPNFTINIDSI